MNDKNIATVLAAVIVLMVIGIVSYAWIHAYATCDGQVVKNMFDWPVCVAKE